MNMRVFGEADGVPVVEVTIGSKAGAQAKIISWGAVLRDLVVPTPAGPQRVTLGLNSLPDYQAHSPSFGATPGRFANRIANGKFTLDEIPYFLDKKPGEKHTLHGGPRGFGKRVMAAWRPRFLVRDLDASFARRRRWVSRQFGPATCRYQMMEPSTLRVELTACATGRQSSISPSMAIST